MALNDSRPYFLNLVKIRLPLPGFVSILHRVSGVLLFLSTPLLVYLFDLSLRGEQGFDSVKEILTCPLSRLILLGLSWAFASSPVCRHTLSTD